jgi:UDP:flavonoid glycosyltransferase YjiC (YdhE family)
LAELARASAHAVVTCDLLFGPMIAAEVAKTPLALLCPNISLFPLPGVPPLGPGLSPATTADERALHTDITEANRALFNRGLSALNAARSALGLAPLAHVFDQLESAERTLLATARAFDFAPDTLPGKVAYVGPQLEDPSIDEPWSPPWPETDQRPLILVSFSTTFQNQGARCNGCSTPRAIYRRACSQPWGRRSPTRPSRPARTPASASARPTPPS